LSNPPRNISYRDLPPQHKNADGKWICRWCGKVCPGRRRSWCCDECLNEYWILRDPGYARRRTYERDKGVCAICGLDTELIEGIVKWGMDERARDCRGSYYHDSQRRQVLDLIKIEYGGAIHLWEADHTVPVAEGGGSCGLDNIRTLCIGCHHDETRKLHGRLANKRKGQGVLLET